MYYRSTDGGANWTPFTPGGGTTRLIGAASTTVAWRAHDDYILRSGNVQAGTPTWTTLGTTVVGGGPLYVQDIDALTASLAWTVSNGTAHRTANAGSTAWSTANVPCNNANTIDATSSSTAFAVGWGDICRTTNSNVRGLSR